MGKRAGMTAGQVRKAIWFKTKIFILDGLLRPSRPWDMVRLGTYYGGWWIPRIEPDQGVAVCVGAGLDVSFDLELKRLGYEVWAADPTPASVEYVREHAPELNLVPVGIWDSEGELSFAQDVDFADSWMIEEGSGAARASGNVKTFPVTTVRGLLDRINQSEVAILKLDIEGAEHRVIRSLIADKVKPATLCIEFDDQRLHKIIDSTRRLRSYGYDLLQIENFNFIYVRRDA